MIKILSNRFSKTIAWLFWLTFYFQFFVTSKSFASSRVIFTKDKSINSNSVNLKVNLGKPTFEENIEFLSKNKSIELINASIDFKNDPSIKLEDIGGPSSPEASSFKSVGSDNLVNLFTGDFSYSIPLIDVGGYPVNLFYSSGIGIEQEASWVGLGWNVNPGSVSRNMRGVPDDFNGTDLLTQEQDVKPNRTFSGEIGGDLEIFGLKKDHSIALNYNNYLGPELELGYGFGATITAFSFVSATKPVQSTAKIPSDSNSLGTSGLNASVKFRLSSRSGLTVAPSLNATLALGGKKTQLGIGLSTSYNSSTGLNGLNLNGEISNFRKTKSNKQDDATKSISQSLFGSNISFVKPSYIPTLRMPIQYNNFSGQLEWGKGMFGIRFSKYGKASYSESFIPSESMKITKPLFGYIYSHQAVGNKDAVMDFNRINDGEVTPTSPLLSAPQYNYDIFSINGEGTGGVIRAYRTDIGFMKDNVTVSKNNNFSIGVDLAPKGHWGGNINVVLTPTKMGPWEDHNNTLQSSIAFKSSPTNSLSENVYFRNPGEATVTDVNSIQRIGNDDLVRFKLSDRGTFARIESQLELFDRKVLSPKGVLNINNSNAGINRVKRTQIVTMLNAAEASVVAIEPEIRNYTGGIINNQIQFSTIPRVGGIRKAHHISQVEVLEKTGMRYIYGIPVYNKYQKDFTFTVANTPVPTAEGINNGLVGATLEEPTLSSPHVKGSSKFDGTITTQSTPAYASAFLLTNLLSPDYVDVTGDGVTEDDLGTAVKMNYAKSQNVHKWRTPRKTFGSTLQPNLANFNAGYKTEVKDNKAFITYGEREAWYLSSIESKAMIAIFKTSNRDDAKGVVGEFDASANPIENVHKKLDTIHLFTKAEIREKGFANARPTKSVVFTYDYSLCTGTPDNATGGGKLTLKSIHFVYNGQASKKEKYVFNYGNLNSTTDNPNYAVNASDRWGTYKPFTANPLSNNVSIANGDYPYTTTNKINNDKFAAAWSLKKIVLPSGGQMEIEYETDDYGYVQNRAACTMMQIIGTGINENQQPNAQLYNSVNGSSDNYFIFVKVPKAIESLNSINQKKEIQELYLNQVKQLAFKLTVLMPKGKENITAYAEYDDWGLCPNNNSQKDIIYLRLKRVNDQSPIALSSIAFLAGNLPGQAFYGYDLLPTTILDFLAIIPAVLSQLGNIGQNEHFRIRRDGFANNFILSESFVRLNNPYRQKYGGGLRVKKVILKDNWNVMTGQYNSSYGQEYDYTTKEILNGKETTISSGIASYEPAVGSEENPFREIISFKNTTPLAPALYGAIESPMLDALFPSPSVGYSKVTVRSINRTGKFGDSAVRSDIGKQVTEFFTAKEYPSKYANTTLSDNASISYQFNSLANIFFKRTISRKTNTQGFLVENNDMHGKMKSQSAYAATDENTPLTASYHTYKNTGSNGMNDLIDFVNHQNNGQITKGNMGIDVELMTDVREFKVQASGVSSQLQIDFFTFVPFPIFALPSLFLKSNSEDLYRAVTTTKLINYHAIEDSVIVMDKGSTVSTKTMVYDAETGNPIVTKTNNEFKDAVYNVNYPAYWAYTSMQPAYKNIDTRFTSLNFVSGKITNLSNIEINNMFESGDEIFISSTGTTTNTCLEKLESGSVTKIWAIDNAKNNNPLNTMNNGKELIFIDANGYPFTKQNVACRIIRSGNRNLVSNGLATFATKAYPVINNYLKVDTTQVIAATAVEYKEKWQTEESVFAKTKWVIDNATCTLNKVFVCDGDLEKAVNPYNKGLLGNPIVHRNMVFYDDRQQTNPIVGTGNIRKDGYLANFSPYWNFNSNSQLVPNNATKNWIWQSEITKINKRGQQLETKDALGIFSSAQYGFASNMPLAVTKNSSYNTMAHEGFEDYNYNEYLNNNNVPNCDYRHLRLNLGYNQSILPAANLNIKAHSGKYVLQNFLSTSDTMFLPVGVKSVSNFDFKFNTRIDSCFYSSPGVTPDSIVTHGIYRTYDTLSIPHRIFNNWAGGNSINLTTGGGSKVHNTANNVTSEIPCQFVKTTELYPGLYKHKYEAISYFSSYFKIENDDIFNIDVNVNISPSIWPHSTLLDNHKMSYQIINSNNEVIFDYARDKDPNWYEDGFLVPIYNFTLINNKTSICLKKGNYKLVLIDKTQQEYNTNNSNVAADCLDASSFYSSTNVSLTMTSQFSSIPIVFYPTKKVVGNTLLGVNTITQPIPATDSMYHKEFQLQPNQQILVSAWVQEKCDSAVCLKTNYNNSCINITFLDSLGNAITPSIGDNYDATGNIKPLGNIIEGWQKVEGSFTVPANAAKMALQFKGPSTEFNYWDDIRIHPFNANMKSYVYDPRTLRLTAELDENNYATFYSYDPEGQLIIVKKETAQGIKTLKETRSSKQKVINDVQ